MIGTILSLSQTFVNLSILAMLWYTMRQVRNYELQHIQDWLALRKRLDILEAIVLGRKLDDSSRN